MSFREYLETEIEQIHGYSFLIGLAFGGIISIIVEILI